MAILATVTESKRQLKALTPAVIAGASAVTVALRAATALAAAIAGVSAVTCAPRYATALAPLFTGQSTVAALLTARTSLVPATIAGAGALTVRLARDGETRGTSDADTRADSNGDTRVLYELA